MKNILVTGGSGWIGKHVVALLHERGYTVHALTSKELPTESSASVQWHHCDLLEPGTPERIIAEIQPTHCLHLAWIATPGVFWTSPLNDDWKRASNALIDAFAAQGGQRFVGVGTCAEYNWSDSICREDITPLLPSTPYGIAKRDTHLHLQEVAAKKNISTAWSHIFHTYGPEEHPKKLVASVILSLLKGERVQCTEGTQIRDFLHVEDIASALVTVLEHDITGSVNIASGKPVTVRHIIEMIATALESDDRIDWGALPLSANDPPSITAATERLEREIGWSARYSLAEGIGQTIEWWRRHSL